AEATLFVSAGRRGTKPITRTFDREALTKKQAKVAMPGVNASTLVACGNLATPAQRVLIVEPDTLTECPDGSIGEIWVSGPSVARSYWNKSGDHNGVFESRVAGSADDGFLRTGDAGVLHEGELFITGRIKDVIILRGRNHYPVDIELTVEKCHAAVRAGSGAAFSVDVNGEERLVAVQEVERHSLRSPELQSVINAIRAAIALQHDIAAYAIILVKPLKIPRTSSGKIRRQACRQDFLDNRLEVLASWALKNTVVEPAVEIGIGQTNGVDELRRRMQRKVSALVNLPEEEIDVTMPFATYGMDSLAVMQMLLELETELGGPIQRPATAAHATIDQTCAQVYSYLDRPEPAQALSSPQAQCEFEQFPEYVRLKQLIEIAEAAGGNPYFSVSESVTSNTAHINGRECINFSLYNYLGLATNPVIGQAAKDAVDRWGTSVSASRVAAGERILHGELEAEIADLLGTEDAITFIGGHTTNVATISAIMRQQDLVVFDAYSHNSVMQGIALSSARALPFRHNDWRSLDQLLSAHRSNYERALVIIEGIYSMDGDIPDLPAFVRVKNSHKSFLMVDEAHSIGVLGRRGRGIGEHFGVKPTDVDLWMGTLSKAFASCGGYIAARKPIIDYLKYSASGFVYSVGLSPPNAASALAAIRYLKANPDLVPQLHSRVQLFLDLMASHGLSSSADQNSPVIPVLVGDSVMCIRLAGALRRRGVNVPPIIHPAVQNHAARLRFFLNSTHTDSQIRYTVDALADELRILNIKLPASHPIVDE
ncbi:MAG: 8-amino-7-oxononanoate synthase, partial [Planctomycetaceae bacterium]|nr:8-amino-7-oxononanoate synthase [Planctomycetaceae bacterium]